MFPQLRYYTKQSYSLIGYMYNARTVFYFLNDSNQGIAVIWVMCLHFFSLFKPDLLKIVLWLPQVGSDFKIVQPGKCVAKKVANKRNAPVPDKVCTAATLDSCCGTLLLPNTRATESSVNSGSPVILR